MLKGFYRIIIFRHITPNNTRTLTLKQLEPLTKPRTTKYLPEDSPHLLAGDFNITAWRDLYSEWLQEEGLTELLDPLTPTFVLGSSLDKCLFKAGSYIPSTFLPPSSTGLQATDKEEAEPEFYPAHAVDFPFLGDHFPI